MSGFVRFMQSGSGRWARIIAGLVLMGIGGFYATGAAQVVLIVVGLVPLLAGLAGICLIGALFGYTLNGEPRSHHVSA